MTRPGLASVMALDFVLVISRGFLVGLVLILHISESWLIGWHLEEAAMRNQDVFVFCFRRLQPELRDMRFDQVGQKQMRER